MRLRASSAGPVMPAWAARRKRSGAPHLAVVAHSLSLAYSSAHAARARSVCRAARSAVSAHAPSCSTVRGDRGARGTGMPSWQRSGPGGGWGAGGGLPAHDAVRTSAGRINMIGFISVVSPATAHCSPWLSSSYRCAAPPSGVRSWKHASPNCRSGHRGRPTFALPDQAAPAGRAAH
jgi:hypothetical protein